MLTIPAVESLAMCNRLEQALQLSYKIVEPSQLLSIVLNRWLAGLGTHKNF